LQLRRFLFQLILLFSASLFVSSCEQSRVFDKNIPLEKEGWFYGEAKLFEVEILDTAIAYNMYVNIRHTDEYPYNNIWLKLNTTLPDGTTQENKINVELSMLTGEWTGNCIDGICYTTVLVQHNFALQQKGKYVFSLEQDMRMNPIPYVLDVGIKVEKFI